MEKIFKIYRRDFKRLSKNVVALVVAVGICILPALYAWFNIAANWDPYGSTDGIEVAVVNLDKKYESGGIEFEIGDQIIENLKSNKQIGWTFVDDDEALDGVKSGKYYAAIVIPKNFSEKMSGILDGKIESPQLKYYVNEKKNAIAPKITDKGATAIQQQVNSTFISVATETVANVLNVTAAQLDSSGVTVVDKLIANLKTVSTDLGTYEQTIDAFIHVTDSVASITDAAEATIPDIEKVIEQGNKTINSSADVLDSSRKTAGTISNSAGNVFGTTQSTFDTVQSLTEGALQNLGTDANTAATQLQSAAKVCDTIIADNSNKDNEIQAQLYMLKEDLMYLQGTLSQEELDAKLASITTLATKVDDLIQAQNTTLGGFRDNLNQVADQITKSTANAEKVRNKISTSLADSKNALSNMKSDYYNEMQPNLNSLMDNISTMSSNLSGLLMATDGSLGDLHTVFKGVNGALGSGKEALNNTKTIVGSTRDKLNNIISQVSAVSKDEQLNQLIDVLKNDPDLTGSFMSSPVQLETTSLYEIENYGSAMAPFYSTLAIWVGAIVLAAIMKVRVDEDDEISSIKPTQAYLGRYLTFLTFGLVQATIIALGDLFYLKIQCLHPVMFFICSWVCSFIFVNIVYSLVVSFGDIGKAVSVILLVIQIGGSGGTFPIEVTPPFFQIINPFLPFTYGINAMRECVAGTYKNAFWVDLGKLMIYLPIALLLGLFLRRPLMKLTSFFEKRLEDSKLL